MEQARKHPDVFTGEEAIAYLHLDALTDDPDRTLETLRANHGLCGQRIGARGFLYHRASLDALIDRAFGVSSPPDVKQETAPACKEKAETVGREPRLKMGGR